MSWETFSNRLSPFQTKSHYIRQWQFIGLLYDICCLDGECEYSLRHEVSDARTEADEICVSRLENYISQWGNSFNTENQGIQNLVTGAQTDKKVSQFLLNVILIAESAYAKFPKRLEYYEKCGPKRKKYIKEKQHFHVKYWLCKTSWP